MGKRKKCENSTLNEQNKQNHKRKSTVIATTEDAPLKEKRVKKKQNNVAEIESKSANKKIIFEDDEPVEAEVETKMTSKSEVSNKKLQSMPDDEAEVRDEDIDAFCDELEEEDNVQFDNWVKLIEEKLGSNKNKHK